MPTKKTKHPRIADLLEETFPSARSVYGPVIPLPPWPKPGKYPDVVPNWDRAVRDAADYIVSQYRKNRHSWALDKLPYSKHYETVIQHYCDAHATRVGNASIGVVPMACDFHKVARDTLSTLFNIRKSGKLTEGRVRH